MMTLDHYTILLNEIFKYLLLVLRINRLYIVNKFQQSGMGYYVIRIRNKITLDKITWRLQNNSAICIRRVK